MDGQKGDSLMQLHASTIVLAGKGLLILGPSGSGKSTLALQLIAAGAELVADDRTDLRRDGAGIRASCPTPLQGRIEARGVGILRAAHASSAIVALAVDLGAEIGDRLPQSQSLELLGVALPLVTSPYRPHLYAALRQLLLHGRAA